MRLFYVPQVKYLLITSPTFIVTMEPKKFASKDATKRSIGEVVEKTLVDLPVYAYNQLFIEKGSSLTWHQLKDTFAKDFEVDLEDRQVYLNFQQSELHKAAQRYPTFSCAYAIIWIVSHVDEKITTLISANGQKLATFQEKYYQHMYHFRKLMKLIDSLFYATHNYVNARDIVKGQVKEP